MPCDRDALSQYHGLSRAVYHSNYNSGVVFNTPIKRTSSSGASVVLMVSCSVTPDIIVHFNHEYLTYGSFPFLSGSWSSLHPLLKVCYQTSQSRCSPYLEKYDGVGSLQISIFSLHSAKAYTKGRPRYHACSHMPSSIIHGQTPRTQNDMQYSGTFSLAWNLASLYWLEQIGYHHRCVMAHHTVSPSCIVCILAHADTHNIASSQ